jgi:hypothetical protein
MALLDLPNELLLDIAQRAGQEGLLALSLTCRQIRHIAQEALRHTATVSPRNIWKLADTLGVRRELAKALTHLHLGPMDHETHDNMLRYNEHRRESLTVSENAAYLALFSEAYPGCRPESITVFSSSIRGRTAQRISLYNMSMCLSSFSTFPKTHAMSGIVSTGFTPNVHALRLDARASKTAMALER